jgi:hypothetical protein
VINLVRGRFVRRSGRRFSLILTTRSKRELLPFEKLAMRRKNRPWLRAILGTTGDFLLARLLGVGDLYFRASDEPQNRTQASFSDRAEPSGAMPRA